MAQKALAAALPLWLAWVLTRAKVQALAKQRVTSAKDITPVKRLKTHAKAKVLALLQLMHVQVKTHVLAQAIWL
jgi:hypothetical protein